METTHVAPGAAPEMTEKERALRALEDRRRENRPKMIDNSILYAGSPMYYYCEHCHALTSVLPESWDPRYTQPVRVCDECANLQARGWI